MSIPALASRIAAVTVYESGAQVTRVAELNLADGLPAEVRIGGLPLCLDDDSLRVRLDAPTAEATGVKVSVEASDREAAPSVEEAAVKEAWREEQLLAQRIQQAKAALARWEQVGVPARHVPRKGDGARPPSPTAARLAVIEHAQKQIAALGEQVRTLDRQHKKAQGRLKDLQERQRQASNAKAPGIHELRKVAIVTLRQLSAAKGPLRAVVEYRVPGARWAPAYTLAFAKDLSTVRLSVRGLVSQRTGEDWSGVRLSVSTAQALRWTELPELPSLRIGRKQPRPARAGWRELPEGAERLYEDYLRARLRMQPKPEKAQAPVPEPPTAMIAVRRVSEVRSCDPPSAPPMPPVPRPPAAPSPASAMRSPGGMMKMFAGGGPSRDRDRFKAEEELPETYLSDICVEETLSESEEASGPVDITSDWLRYGDLRIAGRDDEERGTLVQALINQIYCDASGTELRDVVIARALGTLGGSAEANAEMAPPDGCRYPRDVEGFDYVYSSESIADVPSDGQFHSVPLSTAESRPTMRFVTVPRVSSEVFRFAEFANPLDAPLLDGPADVQIGADFLMTVPLRLTPARGVVRVGLGAEQGIKVARNAMFEEETSGMLGGSLLLKHDISVKVANRLPLPVLVEVRERIPVTKEGDKEVKVQVTSAKPAWEPFEQDGTALQGGYRWSVTVAAGREEELRAAYAVQIPSKNELIGGNRREE